MTLVHCSHCGFSLAPDARGLCPVCGRFLANPEELREQRREVFRQEIRADRRRYRTVSGVVFFPLWVGLHALGYLFLGALMTSAFATGRTVFAYSILIAVTAALLCARRGLFFLRYGEVSWAMVPLDGAAIIVVSALGVPAVQASMVPPVVVDVLMGLGVGAVEWFFLRGRARWPALWIVTHALTQGLRTLLVDETISRLGISESWAALSGVAISGSLGALVLIFLMTPVLPSEDEILEETLDD